MPHLADVRGQKTPFQLASVLSFVKDIAASTVGKQRKDGISSWEAVADYFTQVSQEASRLLPLALEAENTLKSKSISVLSASMLLI